MCTFIWTKYIKIPFFVEISSQKISRISKGANCKWHSPLRSEFAWLEKSYTLQRNFVLFWSRDFYPVSSKEIRHPARRLLYLQAAFFENGLPSAKRDCRYLFRLWKMSIEKASLLALTPFIERDDEKRYRVQKVESESSGKTRNSFTLWSTRYFLKSAGFTFNSCARWFNFFLWKIRVSKDKENKTVIDKLLDEYVNLRWIKLKIFNIFEPNK